MSSSPSPAKKSTARKPTGAARKPDAKKAAGSTAETKKRVRKTPAKRSAAKSTPTEAPLTAPVDAHPVPGLVDADEPMPVITPSESEQYVAATSVYRPANPLRDPQDRRLPRVPEPCALVVFGITGDLARKKLIPAIYDLAHRGLLPANFVLLGFARRDWGDGDFAQLAHDAAQAAARTPWDESVWARLADNIKFVPGDFGDDAAFDRLARTLDQLSVTHGIQSNAAFYLSIPPAFFETVLQQLHRTGMADNDRSGGWRRVVVEKPFGHDLTSGKRLNRLVDDVFGWRDVYRIDHYLGKETVQNLFAFRFANMMFEPIWNSNYVDSVQITMAEDVGIAGRAAFYDTTGAARDVLQNHLLQLLALTAMEEPVRFIPSAIRTEKLKALRAISLPSKLAGHAIRGQYEQGWLAGERVVGYTEEPGIPKDSTTETYAAVKLHVETRRWAGVPFYLRTGKRLPRRVTEIALNFKKAPHLPFAPTDTEELGHNQLVIRVQPDEGVTLRFGSKVPGTVMEVRDVAMDFLYGETFTESSPEAYERLLLDVLLGDATLFPLNEEVEASWAVIDPLEAFWASQPPAPYRAGEWGPKESDEMLARDGRAWRRP
ncbi:glucose-6-phosphate dehydrogenase [Cumulibacter manganitolerans]|uniref:glucose-6-phosphate dehydrogenase n=1 Tax=Cumulibacter manganitolerans TaxID=1884992 RepID=UPI001E32ADFB|nr:glucose-6-phosphate dehydrogenase [Cumulibacter manganitolerans]